MNTEIKESQKRINTAIKNRQIETRCMKRYKDDVQVLEKLELKQMEERAALKTQEETKDAIETDVQNLNEIVKKQEIEKIRLKQQFARMSKKLAFQGNCLDREDDTVYEMDKDILNKRALADVLMEATGLYKVETSETNSIRGFTYNRFNLVTPFDIDTSVYTSKEVTEQFWEPVKRTSPYDEAWEQIFSE